MWPKSSVEGWVRPKLAQGPARKNNRRRARAGAALLALLISPGIQAWSQTPHAHKEHKRDYKREIEAVEQQWRTAQLADDVATMGKLLADDYFGISVAGELNNKSQQLERLEKRTLVFTKIDVSDTKIKVLSGRVAIVTSLAQIDAVNEGTSMKGSFRYTRVYKRFPDGSWKITNFEVTQVPERAGR